MPWWLDLQKWVATWCLRCCPFYLLSCRRRASFFGGGRSRGGCISTSFAASCTRKTHTLHLSAPGRWTPRMARPRPPKTAPPERVRPDPTPERGVRRHEGGLRDDEGTRVGPFGPFTCGLAKAERKGAACPKSGRRGSAEVGKLLVAENPGWLRYKLEVCQDAVETLEKMGQQPPQLSIQFIFGIFIASWDMLGPLPQAARRRPGSSEDVLPTQGSPITPPWRRKRTLSDC